MHPAAFFQKIEGPQQDLLLQIRERLPPCERFAAGRFACLPEFPLAGAGDVGEDEIEAVPQWEFLGLVSGDDRI